MLTSPASLDSEKMLPDPPLGWIELQERAKRAKTPEELSAIINEMNQLLAKYEKAAGGGHSEG